MAYKKNKRKLKIYKNKKYSKEEKRSYWVGYGIALAEKKSDSTLYRNEGERFLESGYVPSVKSANIGYEKAKADSENRRSKRFTPKKYW